MDEELLTTGEAAARLGVTSRRVCQLVARGALPVVELGRSSLIPASAVTSRLEAEPSTGRPWSPRTTWAVVWLVEGREPDWVHERTLRRLRRTAGSITGEELRRRVDRLTVRTAWAAPTTTITAVSTEPGVVRAPTRQPEVWLPASRAAGLPGRYGLAPGSDLFVVAVAGMWPFGPDDAAFPLSLLQGAHL